MTPESVDPYIPGFTVKSSEENSRHCEDTIIQEMTRRHLTFWGVCGRLIGFTVIDCAFLYI